MNAMPQSPLAPGAVFVEGSVVVDGRAIRFARAGAGPDLIMLPTSSGLTFNFGADLLAQDFRVTMLEPPGWGESPPEQKSDPLPELAHTTAAAIAAMGIDRFYLTGGSMGGIHALWVTAHYPDRVRAVMVDNSMAFRKDNWAQPGFDPVAFARAAEQGMDVSAMLPREHPRKPWATLEFRQRKMRSILRVIEFTGPEFDEDLADRLRRLDTPALVLCGANDHFVFPSVAKVYEGILKNVRTVIVEDTGHDIPGEQPERYAELIKGFIADLPPE
jgi:pimeloyl-ACP methyl ester carboxylesterase